MTEQPKKKVKKFGPKKGGASIMQSSKKRNQVPIAREKKQSPPPLATPAPLPLPEEIPTAQPIPTAHEVPVPLPQPIPLEPTPVPVPQPTPLPEPIPLPQPVAVEPTPAQTPPPTSTQSALPPLVPQNTPQAAVPPSINGGVITLKPNKESINAPTHIQSLEKPLESKEKTSQKKVLQGKPANQTETEDLKDEVASYLEVCDSCLSEKNAPKEIIDVLHMLVRSLNFDVVTIALLDERKENLISEIASRGYENPPGKSVVECWEKAILKGKGMDWKVLMKIAGDNQIDLAYWIVQEGLDSIGYVPIRDSQTIYGFIFVAAVENKTQSSLSSLLLDACGSRIGMANSLNANKGDWPETVLHLAQDIRNQFSLLMGYTEMLRESAALSQEQIDDIIENCNKTIIESTQMLDSMTSEALGE